MKSLIIFLVCISTMSYAGYPAKIQYWYYNNVSTNVPTLNSIITLQDNSDGTGVQFNWKITNFPSRVVIDAIDNTIAVDWFTDYKLDKEVDYLKWSASERRRFKLLIKLINRLRVKDGDPAYTKEQIMQALKGE